MLGAGRQQSSDRPTDDKRVPVCIHGRMPRDRGKLFHHSALDQYADHEYIFAGIEQSIQQVQDHLMFGFGRLAYQRGARTARKYPTTLITTIFTATQSYGAHMGLHPGAKGVQQPCFHFY